MSPDPGKSGRPPGAVPVHEGYAQLAAVLGGDDELQLGDAHRLPVVLGLEQAAGGQRDRGQDEDVLGGWLCHGRSSRKAWGPPTLGPPTHGGPPAPTPPRAGAADAGPAG